jgi:hypothetical protein
MGPHLVSTVLRGYLQNFPENIFAHPTHLNFDEGGENHFPPLQGEGRVGVGSYLPRYFLIPSPMG